MVLPSTVNVINDSKERIKIRVDVNHNKKSDEIINIEAGERHEITGTYSNWGKSGKQLSSDIVIDLITNPEGPKNNERQGSMSFDNPGLGPPTCHSKRIGNKAQLEYISTGRTNSYVGPGTLVDGLDLKTRYERPWRGDEAQRPLKTYWASWSYDERRDILPNQLPKGSEELYQSIVKAYTEVSFIATVQAFMHDNGAKTWDLRIASEGFIPSASDFEGFA